jgi:hypothetical protein
MRITPNHPRLRAIALACWATGGWWLWQAALLGSGSLVLIATGSVLVAALSLSLGVAYWQLGNDRRAGIVFDAKGLMLNLGSSSAFVAWDNIAAVGVCRERNTLLTLGSQRQLGIRLHDPQPYLQSYEARLPAARGPLAAGLAVIHYALAPLRHNQHTPQRTLMRQRARTGYDVLVPDTLLGGSAHSFAQLVETYRSNPAQRPSPVRWL